MQITFHQCDGKIVEKIIKSIDETGHNKIGLKSDGEPAIVQVQERIKELRKHDTILDNPPGHDPQSNGDAERAVQEVKAQLRAIYLALEARLTTAMDKRKAVVEWMIPHAADTINRFLVGRDGRTPYFRIHEKNFAQKVLEFGEQVMAKPKRSQKTTRKNTLASRWREATWVGFDNRTNEHVVLSEGGPAMKVRTVKPRAEGDRWSLKAINDIEATPDVPNPKDRAQPKPKNEADTGGLDFGTTGGEQLPKESIRREATLTRDFRITEAILERHGHTLPGCPGCAAKIEGREPRGHSAACRRRIEEAIVTSGIGIEKVIERDLRRQEHVDEEELDTQGAQAEEAEGLEESESKQDEQPLNEE